MKYSGILLVSDLDGTLLDKDSSLSDENAEAVNEFMRQGGKFAFASGRYFSNMKAFMNKIRPNIPSITSNGQMIYDYDTDSKILEYNLPEDADIIAALFAKSLPDVATCVTAEDGRIYICHQNKATDFIINVVRDKYTITDKLYEVPMPWIKISMWIDEDRIHEITDFMKKLDLSDKYRFFRSHQMAYEILNSKADKGLALNEYKRLFPEIKTSISIGDNENDALMLKNADLSFCPSNAMDYAKAAATHVLSCDNNGPLTSEVIKKIDKYVER